MKTGMPRPKPPCGSRWTGHMGVGFSSLATGGVTRRSHEDGDAEAEATLRSVAIDGI